MKVRTPPDGAEVIDLAEHRPHVTLLVKEQRGKADVRVIPVVAVEGWASGRLPLPGRAVLRAIVREWLRQLRAAADDYTA